MPELDVDFYEGYYRHRRPLSALALSALKRDYRRNLWVNRLITPSDRVLDIGCGTGLLLDYLSEQGVLQIAGLEQDARVLSNLSPGTARRITIGDATAELGNGDFAGPFDKILLIDVLEHFSPSAGVALLRSAARVLSAEGRIVIRVPNGASPWAGQFQNGDVTHRACYAPSSISQVAAAAGCRVIEHRPWSGGTAVRSFVDRVVHRALSSVIVEAPPIWSGNLLSVLAAEHDGSSA